MYFVCLHVAKPCFSVSEELLCAFELLKPLDAPALRKEMTKAKRKRSVSAPLSGVCETDPCAQYDDYHLMDIIHTSSLFEMGFWLLQFVMLVGVCMGITSFCSGDTCVWCGCLLSVFFPLTLYLQRF